MNCEDYSVLLSGHLDEMNTPQEEEELQAHLAQCASCRKLLEQMCENDRKMREECPLPPLDLKNRIMAEVHKTKKSKKPFYISLAASSLAAAAALTVAFSGHVTPPTAQEAPSATVASYELKSPERKRIDFAVTEAPCEDATEAPCEDVMEAPGAAYDYEVAGSAFFAATTGRENKDTQETTRALLVIHADADEVEFSGKRSEISAITDVLSKSGYVLSGKESSFYTVSWQEFEQLAAQYDAYDMEAYYDPDTIYEEAVVIFVK